MVYLLSSTYLHSNSMLIVLEGWRMKGWVIQWVERASSQSPSTSRCCIHRLKIPKGLLKPFRSTKKRLRTSVRASTFAMYELRNNKKKGRCLYATRNIKAGEVVLDEVCCCLRRCINPSNLTSLLVNFLNVITPLLPLIELNRKRIATSSLKHIRSSAAHSVQS